MIISKESFPDWQSAKKFVQENVVIECGGMEEDSYIEAKLLLDELRKEFSPEKVTQIVIALDFLNKK